MNPLAVSATSAIIDRISQEGRLISIAFGQYDDRVRVARVQLDAVTYTMLLKADRTIWLGKGTSPRSDDEGTTMVVFGRRLSARQAAEFTARHLTADAP